MSGKKDRGRFTLRLNEKDPAHAEVIRVLEQQPPHSIGRFIANAVLHYVHCSETPDIPIGQTLDRAAIEELIRNILRQQGLKGEEGELTEQIGQTKNLLHSERAAGSPHLAEREDEKEASAKQGGIRKSDTEESTRALIQNTLFAFRNNNG